MFLQLLTLIGALGMFLYGMNLMRLSDKHIQKTQFKAQTLKKVLTLLKSPIYKGS